MTWEPFTPAQKRQVRWVIETWIAAKCMHEQYFRSFITGPGFKPEYLASKIGVDADHSMLLRRLLDGETPTKEPSERS